MVNLDRDAAQICQIMVRVDNPFSAPSSSQLGSQWQPRYPLREGCPRSPHIKNKHRMLQKNNPSENGCKWPPPHIIIGTPLLLPHPQSIQVFVA